jgi:hypothetical protein
MSERGTIASHRHGEAVEHAACHSEAIETPRLRLSRHWPDSGRHWPVSGHRSLKRPSALLIHGTASLAGIRPPQMGQCRS